MPTGQYQTQFGSRIYTQDQDSGQLRPNVYEPPTASAFEHYSLFEDSQDPRLILPSPDVLASMDKKTLLDILEQARSRGVDRSPTHALPTGSPLSDEEEDVFRNKFQGDWASQTRTLSCLFQRGDFASGDRRQPIVYFKANAYRDPGVMQVSNLRVSATDTEELSGVKSYFTSATPGSLKFTVTFPPDEANQTGRAEWTLYPSGNALIEVNDEISKDVLARPIEKKLARRRHGAAKMLEPSSKALGLFDDMPPFQLYDQDGKPWCLPILRTEAALRLDDSYIGKTSPFFDVGEVPPNKFCEDAERTALQLHNLSEEWIEPYRFATRMLSKTERSEIFFLQSNDQLFKPQVDLVGRRVEGELFNEALKSVAIEDVLSAPKNVLIASTSS